MPVLIKLLSQWKVFDSPGGHKIHSHFTPSMGGVCILMGAAFAQVIALPLAQWAELKFFYISVAMMFITGLRDDILTLSPRQKLIGQVLPIIIVVLFGDTVIESFYGVILDGLVFPEYIAWGVTIFTIVILTNAYNLIDGLDGLAGTVGATALFTFGVWFYLAGYYPYAMIAFSLGASVIAFLYYNWQPSRIFMGDTGALMIGIVLSYLTIHFLKVNHGLDASNPIKFTSSVGTAICVMIIPVFDTLRVIVLRLRKLQSPFHADKNHLHHQFLKLGLSHGRTTLLIAAINVLFIVLAFILKSKPDSVLLGFVTVLCLGINFALRVAVRKHARNGGKSLIPEAGN